MLLLQAPLRAQGIRPWPCSITVPDAGHKRGVIGLRGFELFTSAGANGSDGLSLGGDGGVFCLRKRNDLAHCRCGQVSHSLTAYTPA